MYHVNFSIQKQYNVGEFINKKMLMMMVITDWPSVRTFVNLQDDLLRFDCNLLSCRFTLMNEKDAFYQKYSAKHLVGLHKFHPAETNLQQCQHMIALTYYILELSLQELLTTL